MGLRYLLFRLKHELLRKTGLLAKQFPVNPPFVPGPDLQTALAALENWPWSGRDSFDFVPQQDFNLQNEAEELLAGKIRLIGTRLHSLEGRDDWHRHPETGYVYNKNQHWTLISDFSAEAGDIKFVWERARFGYLQTIMRYDLQAGSDHSAWVLEEIESFIAQNPLNCGPHYRCSQEISLRIFNWLGAISFYRKSPQLTEDRWQRIWHHLYWQAQHVRQNIHFSRISVRNNHAITETLLLYVFGSLFPDAPGCREWQQSGKRWFEQEIAYQIYPDGSYLQFSVNYHRVVVQLITFALSFSKNTGEPFRPFVKERARASLDFLRFFMDRESGWLPNYGANDGSLFFRFSHAAFRDYRPQLEALAAALGDQTELQFDEARWFGFKVQDLNDTHSIPQGIRKFADGGFAGIRTEDSVLFMRCGKHKDRPSQADNLHLDLWYQGENILRDAGSYKYNSSPEFLRFFSGTEGHNAILLDGADQMQKGPRFIWLHWSQATLLEIKEEEDFYTIAGEISAFGHLADGIRHRRTVRASKYAPEWWIEDEISGAQDRKATLLWHPGPSFADAFKLEVTDRAGGTIQPEIRNGWYSSIYGIKEPASYFAFQSKSSLFRTRISKA